MDTILLDTLPQSKILPKELEDFLKNLQVKFHHHIKCSPSIDFNKRRGRLNIKGESISMFSRSLFYEVTDRVDDYLDLNDELLCYLEFSIINSLTTRGLMDLFNVLNIHHSMGKQVRVEWTIYEGDEDLKTTAEDLKCYCNFPFTIISAA